MLSPLHFIIYINDLDVDRTEEGVFLDADDTSVVFKEQTADDKSAKSKIIMEEVEISFSSNKLYLNTKKVNNWIFP